MKAGVKSRKAQAAGVVMIAKACKMHRLIIENGAAVTRTWVKIFAVLLLISMPVYAEDRQQDAMPYEEWSALSLRELKERLAVGELDPNQAVVYRKGSVSSQAPMLYYAVRHKNVDYIRTLLAYGADLAEEERLLNEAIINNERDKVALLVQFGADVKKEFLGVPPILAISKMINFRKVKNEEIKQMMSLLVESGADINVTDKDSTGIVNFFSLVCRPALVAHAADLGAAIYKETIEELSPLKLAVIFSPDAVSVLIAKGANVNQKDSGGFSILYHAVLWGHRPAFTAEQLIAAGADIKGQYASKTLLERATLRAAGTKSLYRDIVDIGLPPNYCDNSKEYDIKEWQQGGQEVLELLTRHIKQQEGLSPS